MQLSDKSKEYLINSLMRDKEELERKVYNKEDVIAQIGKYNADLTKQIEDLKYKFYQKDDECCELKKKVKRLEDDKTFHINELQKNNNAVKEVGKLKNKIKLLEEDNNILNDEIAKLEKDITLRNKKVIELEEELLKKVIIECKPKGRPPKCK